jgi:metallo-beta-lactamase class B
MLAGCVSPQSPRIATGPDEWSAACEDWDEWDKPAPPYRLHGSTYYVGTCGIAAMLITGESGHILIDAGTEGGAPIIMRNIEAAGFRLSDVEYILSSHEHFDHVGGIAMLQKATGASVIASHAAAPVLASGRASADDPQGGMHDPFAPVSVAARIRGGSTIELGDIALTAIETPGHTPGALSWHWKSCDNSGCRDMVYADSLSPISRDDYRFTDHPEYIAAFRAGLGRLRAAPCDFLITPHPSASDLPRRLRGEAPLVDAEACVAYADGIEARLDKRLAEEAS